MGTLPPSAPRRWLTLIWLAPPRPAGTFRLPDPVPVAPLAQLNLKLSPAVLADWRRRAREAGHGGSVRDWILATLAPTAEAPAGPAGAAGLADRVAQLEAATAELRKALGRLQPHPPRSPRPAPAAAPPAPTPADLPAGSLETAAVADRLGVKRGTFNARISRAGGAAPGLVIDGWRCIGSRTPERGGPPRAVWVPAGTPEVEGLAPDGSDDRVPPEGA